MRFRNPTGSTTTTTQRRGTAIVFVQATHVGRHLLRCHSPTTHHCHRCGGARRGSERTPTNAALANVWGALIHTSRPSARGVAPKARWLLGCAACTRLVRRKSAILACRTATAGRASERASDTFGNQRPGTWPAARRTEVRAWHGCWAVSGVDEEAGRALGEPDCGVSVNKHTTLRHLSLRRRDPTDTTQHSLTHSRWGCPPGWPPGGPGRRGTVRWSHLLNGVEPIC